MFIPHWFLAVIAVVHGTPLTDLTNWFAPLEATPSGIRRSHKPNDQIINNEFFRMTFRGTFGMVCAPYYYDVSQQIALVYYDANKTVHRTIESKLKCTPTIVEYGEHFFVPHCALDAGRVAAQFGYVDATSNRSFTMMEFCKSNVTHEIIFGQSRLQHHSIDDGEQLPLTATQLHSNLADNIGHSPFDDKDRLLLEDMFAKEDRGFKPDELAYAWSTPQGVRSYLAWRLFLFNAHKFGLEYLVQAAPQMAGRLVPVVELIRESAKATEAPLDLYTGFSDEVSDIRSESTGKMVKVPTFVWFLADRESAPSDGVVYVVVNGNLVLPREMCENRCVGPVYCCRIGEIGKHVSIINELFIDSSDL